MPYKYIEYGNYASQWRKRLPLKLWTGWTTFPMVFVDGQLVGGCDIVTELHETGQLKELVNAAA